MGELTFVIWKYRLERAMSLPKGARVVHVGTQAGGIHLWAEVDPHAPVEERRFGCWPTGVEVPLGKHLATLVLMSGELVLHVYEHTVFPDVARWDLRDEESPHGGDE